MRKCLAPLILAGLCCAAPAGAEILAAMNYETKGGIAPRREGIAIVDIDPASPTFNTIVKDAPLPPDFIAHHIYFNKGQTKAYVTSLGRSAIAVFDLSTFPEKVAIIPVPDCKVGEDMVFSDDRKRWFLSCMGSSNVIMGDAQSDETLKVIAAPQSVAAEAKPFIKHPHGLTLNENLDLLIATSTVNPSDFKEAGDTIAFIEASTGTLRATHRVSSKPSPAAEAPVETAFIPNREPRTAYITNMLGGTLWAATWRPDRDVELQQVYDFAPMGQGVPLEMEFSETGDRLYVTTAKPGALNVFDIADPRKPKLLSSTPTAAGAHHFVFSPDRRYAFVQNSLLNLPDMSDGSVSVVDLASDKLVARIDVLQKAGLNPNCIILMPKWRRAED
ncbi:MAG: hypothetical protein U1E25_12830 [Methylocystis sp.]